MLENLNIQKIAIFRALQLGDMLCAIPAIRALRAAYPNAHITLISLPWAKELLLRFPSYFDSFISFPGYPGLPEQSFDEQLYNDFVSRMRSQHFDLILQMQGNGTIVNQMIRSYEARFIAGYIPPGQSNAANELRLPYPKDGHEISRHLRLMGFLGIPLQGDKLEFPITNADRASFQQLNLPIQPKQYICIHPGSRGRWRQWPPLYFAALGDYCLKQNYQVVITGTKEELPIVNQVVSLMKSPPLVVAGKTSLGSAAVLLNEAFALIANCTGVSHMAAALETQSVIISMDGEPERWAPLNKELHVTIDWTKVADFQNVLKEVATLFFRL